MKVEMDTGECRNAQCGDWKYGDNFIEVAVKSMSDWRYELLVQVHELVEAALCKQRGITDDEVTAFDMQFEEERAAGLHSPTEEDGDDPSAPYHKEHFAATNIERLLARELGVVWSDYEEEIKGVCT